MRPLFVIGNVATLAFAAAAAFLACDGGTGPEGTDSPPADAAVSGDGRGDAELPIDTECAASAAPAARVPAPYAGLRSPLSPTANVLLAGRTRFSQRCALCHGDSGRGDGREGPFVPPAADLTATLRGEDYVFWRISEGGNVDPFCTAMPAFGRLYTEQARWELVAHVRDLAGAGDAGVSDAGAGD